MRLIASINGGGAFGLIPALVLAEIEKRLNRRSVDIFSMLAGTSTGGIIACGLAAGLPAASLALLYHDHGAEIFRKSFSNTVKGLDGLSGPIYGAATLERLLKASLGDKTLSDAQSHLLVPTTRCNSPAGPIFFKSWQGPNFRLRDVARATSAAPIYFPPAQISPIDGAPMICIDGGLHSNDPEDWAVTEACKLWPDEQIAVISFGTGYEPLDIEAQSDWGGIDWLKGGLLSLTMYCSEANAAARAAEFGHARVRLDAAIGGDMDDASPENISAMTKAAQRIIAGPEFAAALDLASEAVTVNAEGTPS
jgi:patatin-like phospholipase/acyl hydrolase